MNIMRVDAMTQTRGIKRNAPLHLLFAFGCIMHALQSSANGSSSSPIATFAPPSRFLVRHDSSTSQRAPARFDYGKTRRSSSVRESPATNTNREDGEYRKGAVVVPPPIIPKRKSPSNPYTQFYKEDVLVGIERTSPNSRRISGEIMTDIPIDDIWNILTDYDNLSTHVPNLMESRVINNVGGKPRVYQRGAQRIFGFEFGADVTMDMTEHVHPARDNNGSNTYSIAFECVDSQFFSQFDGSWILEECNSKVMVRYIVDVRPKGPVPVAALEWRIKEDVPVNILAVSKSATARSAQRGNRERGAVARREESPVTQTQPLQQSPTREVPATTKPQMMNPLQKLTDQAAYNLKQTAKILLPSPVFSTAKQAINAMNGSNPLGGSRQNVNVVPSMSSNGGTKGNRGRGIRNKITAARKLTNKLSRKKTSDDWYDDETMGWYLKDS